MSQLICIYGNPRSGTSLVAKIFRAHGVWTGLSKNIRGYRTYEWDSVKFTIRGNCNWSDRCVFTNIRSAVLQRVDELITERKERHILFKSPPDYHQVMERYNPIIVTVRRHIDSVLASQINGSVWPRHKVERWKKVILRRIALMDEMNAPVVDTDEILNGDFSSIKKAIEHCGLPFDFETTERQIDRKIWHHKK